VISMSRESSTDILDTIKGIHKLLDSIELKQVLITLTTDVFKFILNLVNTQCF